MVPFESARIGPAGYREISVAELTLPPNGFRLIDVREPAEFTGELGHIPGAELVPMASVGAHCVTWNKDLPLVLVCRSGGRSGSVAQALTARGFTTAVNLVGGMLAWNAAKREVER